MGNNFWGWFWALIFGKSQVCVHVQACQDAHAQVVTWSSWSDFVANSVLAFFMVLYYPSFPFELLPCLINAYGVGIGRHGVMRHPWF